LDEIVLPKITTDRQWSFDEIVVYFAQ